MLSYFRFLKRNPFYTIINVLGLSVALMFVITIGDFTLRQFRVERNNPNADKIFLLGDLGSFRSWPDEARLAGETVPEIENICSVVSTSGVIRSDNNEMNVSYEPSILLVDSTFFQMFNYTFKKGNSESALSSPDNCIITESTANELFPDEDPLGQPLRIIGNRYDFVDDDYPGDPYDSTAVYVVSAVIKDLDRTVISNNTRIIANTQKHPQILGYRMSGSTFVSNTNGFFKTFYQIRRGADIKDITNTLNVYLKEHVRALSFLLKDSQTTTLTPLRKVLFAPQNIYRDLEHGDYKLTIILLFSICAILVFAVTNYVNLTVANTGMRSKEMATRRLLGSSGESVSVKFILESMLMVLLAFLMGLLLSFLLQDKFAELFRGRIHIQDDFTLPIVLVCMAFVLLTGFLSGLIPGIQISSIKPIDVVKGSFRYKSKNVFSRVFIMIQNLITVVLLSLSLVATLHVNGLVNAPLGVNSKDIVVVAPLFTGKEASIREVLEHTKSVERIGTTSGNCPLGYLTAMTMDYDLEGIVHTYYWTSMDKEAFDIYGFDVIRDDIVSGDKVYFSEELMRSLNLDQNAQSVEWRSSMSPISGVVGDIHNYGSVLNDVLPIKITVTDKSQLDSPYYIIKTDGSRDAFKVIDEAIKEAFPDEAEDMLVIDMEKHVYNNFEEQRNTLHIIYMFTGIAVILSILGFIGLSLFFIRQRRNEIATRRVFGGSVNDVIALMLTKFCWPLAVSCILAVPVAYLAAERWLQDFSWRISLRPWIFIAACLASILIAVLSILWQTISAVRRNPVESIKSE